MIAFEQTTRPVRIHSPLGEGALTVVRYEGDESVSGLFCYRLELRAADAALDFSRVMGQGACLEIGLSGGGSRLVHGVVSRFSQTGVDAGGAFYAAELRPWLWLLTMNSNCRIFQKRSIPEILHEIFSELGFADVTESLHGSYPPREYCVQYAETDFDFVSRLMEEEGIFYYFEHERGAHRLVLADGAHAWGQAAGPETARLAGPEMDWKQEDVIQQCSLEQRITVGEVASADHNFETPQASLFAKTSGRQAARSVYQYPGRYELQQDGEARTGIRLEAYEAEALLLRGQSTCRGWAAGCQFGLQGHPRAEANVSYVVSRLSLRGSQDEYASSFEAFPASVRYRPAAATRRPVIAGTQTATVTGKAGEEIWTDRYGRVKVKFHWDQSATKEENTSCWIRVAQGWAGKNWGSFFLPRIGQEVVVSFLEGNPDRPLITGCVYNADQTTPYALPAEQTKSTLKSRSSKGGSGWNEFRFEDKAGSEEVYLRAQKDMKEEVLDARQVSVGGEETHTVEGARQLSVKGDEKHVNQANYSAEVKGNYTLQVSGNLVIKAGGSVTIEAGTTMEQSAGTNFTNKAGAVLTSKAGAEHVVDGGGLVVVKGGLIKLN